MKMSKLTMKSIAVQVIYKRKMAIFLFKHVNESLIVCMYEEVELT